MYFKFCKLRSWGKNQPAAADDLFSVSLRGWDFPSPFRKRTYYVNQTEEKLPQKFCGSFYYS